MLVTCPMCNNLLIVTPIGVCMTIFTSIHGTWYHARLSFYQPSVLHIEEVYIYNGLVHYPTVLFLHECTPITYGLTS